MLERILLAAVLLLAISTGTIAQETPAPAPVVRPVKVATVSAEDPPIRRRFFGQVRARQTTDLAFQVGGQVFRLPVVEGEPVAEGDLVAQLDLEPFELDVRQAEVQLGQARRDRERLESLGPDTVSEVNIEDARDAERLAEINLRETQDRLDDATLRAPFDGLVVRREVANFTTVAAGSPVVRLHDMSELRVDIEVPEVLFRRARSETDIRFSATFPGSEETHPLILREFEAETTDVGQTYTITLAFEEMPGPGLLPGASATVVAEARDEDPGVMFVPDTALVYGPDRQPSVMVFESGEDGAGTVTRQSVEIEVAADGRVRVVSGLESGTEIVVAGAAQLRDGQAVRRYATMED